MKLFKKSSDKKRDLSYEFIRIFAMLLIILTHEINTYLGKGSTLATCMEIFTAVGVTLFFMLSGRFAFKLNLEDKSLYKKFYFKKIVGLIIPMVIYMLIKNWHVMVYNQHLSVSFTSYFKHLGVAMINGFSYMEYWFLYILIALFIAVPFTARMMQNLTRRDKKAFIIVALIFTTLSTFIPEIFHVEFAVKYYFIGYVLFFFVGAFIEEFFTRKSARIKLYLLGILSFVMTCVLCLNGIKNGYKSFSPLYFIYTTAMFIGLHELGRKITTWGGSSENSITNKIIATLGKHSLGVYMFHMIVLYFINDLNFLPSGIFEFFAAGIIVCIISSIVCLILDETIIKWCQKIFIKIFCLKNVIK